MKVLLLNGIDPEDTASEQVYRLVLEEFRQLKHETNIMDLHELKIASCLGCFGCWIKTPGICVINDAGREVAKAMMQNDLVIGITPITFGGYSYQYKKALDRLIPNVSPFFMKKNGETHHKPRYTHYPRWITIGLLSERNEEMEEIFRNILSRNATNLHADYTGGILLNNSSRDDIQSSFHKFLNEVGVV